MKAVVVGPFPADALAVLSAAIDTVNVEEIRFNRVQPHLSDADVLITRRLAVDGALYDAAPRLRLVVKLGTGVDEIDVTEAARRGITVRNTHGVNAPAVAELTIGLMVGLARKIAFHQHRLRQTRRWDRELGAELYGKTLGVVGVGHVGSRVAGLGRAMEMHVIGTDPYIDPATAAVPLLAFEELLARSHVVSLHVPLTHETHSMVNRQTLSLMRDGAFLVNTSRGEVIDEPSVIEALDAGRLFGYAADVLSNEIPGMEITSPLLDHPGVLLTPHLGAWAEDTQHRVCHAAVAIVQQWIAERGTPVR